MQDIGTRRLRTVGSLNQTKRSAATHWNVCRPASPVLTMPPSRDELISVHRRPHLAAIASVEKTMGCINPIGRPGMADGRLILWGAGTSRTIRAHWALHELDLPYERRPIQPRTGETKTPEFTALSARQKIPLLQDKDMVITESAAIVTYLSDIYGQPHNRLLPEDVRERARCLEWCFFVISVAAAPNP